MKYVKMLGLLAIAAAALMAFAGTASATLTEEPGDPVDVGDTLHAESEGASSLTGSITITCQKSTVEGQFTSNGATTATGNVETLTFEECGNHTVTVVKKGSLSVETVKEGEGTVKSTGAEVTVLLHSALLGTLHCIYTTNGTDIGILTSSKLPTKTDTTTTARLHVTSAAIPRSPTDGACGSESFWECTYKIIRPHTFIID